MANKRISELNEVTTASNSDLIPIVNSGETKKINALNLKTEVVRITEHTVTSVSTTQSLSIGNESTINVLIIENAGLSLTLQFPTSPLQGQIVHFTTFTNTVNLIVGNATGTGEIKPTYGGAATEGFKVSYVYHEEKDTWYLIG